MPQILLAPWHVLTTVFHNVPIVGIALLVALLVVVRSLLKVLRRRLGIRTAVAVPVACAIVVVVAGVLLGVAALVFNMRDVPTHELALERLNACPAARAALDTPIRLTSVGDGTYTAEGAFGASTWRLDVSGPKRTAELDYAAEMHGGRWALTRLILRVDGKVLDLDDCR